MDLSKDDRIVKNYKLRKLTAEKKNLKIKLSNSKSYQYKIAKIDSTTSGGDRGKPESPFGVQQVPGKPHRISFC